MSELVQLVHKNKNSPIYQKFNSKKPAWSCIYGATQESQNNVRMPSSSTTVVHLALFPFKR